MDQHLIEIAYECAKKRFNKDIFTFNELLKNILKDHPECEPYTGDLYVDLLQDIRFISLGKQKWGLRENYTLAEIKKINSLIFGLEEEDYEKDAEEFMSEAEKEVKTKTEEEEPTPIFSSEFKDEEESDENDETGDLSELMNINPDAEEAEEEILNQNDDEI